MPTLRPLYPGEIEIEPPIFSFHVMLPVERMSGDEIIAAQTHWNEQLAECVSETGGQIYLAHRWVVFFGYPYHSASQAISLARQARERMDTQHHNPGTLSVSTVGLARYSHVYAHPLEHLGDPDLPEILLARTKFR